MSVTVLCAEVLQWAETYTGAPFHALLCDPPYHLLSDTRNGSQRQPGTGPYGRHTIGTKGFMSHEWDGGGVSFNPDIWKALAQHLLPGAFLMVFGGSRTYHRLACALEDAGLNLHPALGWVQGQGFPKATRIPDDRFAGHRYGRQALKPAFEFIAVAQVPYAGRPVDSIVQYGAGALNIEGGRIVGPAGKGHWSGDDGSDTRSDPGYDGGFTRGGHHAPSGRWPPNFAACHSPSCRQVGTQQIRGTHPIGPHPGRLGYHSTATSHPSFDYTAPDGTETVPAWVCTADCTVAALDAQAGVRRGGAMPRRRTGMGYHGAKGQEDVVGRPGDTGVVSRFFAVHDWAREVAEQLASAAPVYYAGKASPRERHTGLDARNGHPTVKPLALCQWLCTLLAPPVSYAPRRLLVPFAGSGSECIAALLSGHWEAVVGIEQQADYCAIARQRVQYWTAQAPTAEPARWSSPAAAPGVGASVPRRPQRGRPQDHGSQGNLFGDPWGIGLSES